VAHFTPQSLYPGVSPIRYVLNKGACGPRGSNTEVVGSNPIVGMDVCAFILCAVVCVGSGLATG
jgi:hypothetical protein